MTDTAQRESIAQRLEMARERRGESVIARLLNQVACVDAELRKTYRHLTVDDFGSMIRYHHETDSKEDAEAFAEQAMRAVDAMRAQGVDTFGALMEQEIAAETAAAEKELEHLENAAGALKLAELLGL